MAPESYLTIGEFERALEKQTRLIMAGFGSTNTLLHAHGERLAAVETKLSERTVSAASGMTKKEGVGWSTAVAGGIWLVLEAVKTWVK